MRFLARLIVLGLAGIGVYKTWELLAPKVSEVRQRAAGARDKIEPAIREATDTLQSVTKDAADTITESASDSASRDDFDEMASSVIGSPAEKVPTTPKMAT